MTARHRAPRRRPSPLNGAFLAVWGVAVGGLWAFFAAVTAIPDRGASVPVLALPAPSGAHSSAPTVVDGPGFGPPRWTAEPVMLGSAAKLPQNPAAGHADVAAPPTGGAEVRRNPAAEPRTAPAPRPVVAAPAPAAGPETPAVEPGPAPLIDPEPTPEPAPVVTPSPEPTPAEPRADRPPRWLRVDLPDVENEPRSPSSPSSAPSAVPAP